MQIFMKKLSNVIRSGGVPGIQKVGALLKVQWKIKWQYRKGIGVDAICPNGRGAGKGIEGGRLWNKEFGIQ